MKSIPAVSKYMTSAPFTIEKDKSLIEAANLMKDHSIRHLPVTWQGKLEGVLTSTDINMIRTIHGVDLEVLKVYDCFTPNPEVVSINAPLDEVLSTMANHKYGCMPVVDNGKIVGIFTWVDALRAASELLHTRLK